MSEIYIEGRFKMPVFNTDEFGYDDEEVKKFDWEDFAKDEFWNSCDDMGELEDKYDITFHKVQPQLTIPKSIAECLINFIEINRGTDFIIEELIYFKNMERSHCFEPELKLHDFVQNNTNICVLYLAGKALGVDLVKVV